MHVNAFPATHLKRLDIFDFAMKFSGELLILILALGVAIMNLHFFGFGSSQYFNDQSFAADLLSKHQYLNSKLAAKNSATITMFTATSLIERVQADDFAGLDPSAVPDSSANGFSATFTDNGIAAPSPDSIKAMVTNVAKKVYTTRPGDSLKSIAAANGISVNSILWSNPALTSDTIQPDWDLIIPPANGVAVTADSNTTLPDLAAKYNPLKYSSDKKARDASAAQLLETIISYNGLDSAEDINPGDYLFIPDGVLATAPTPPAPPKTPKAKSGASGGSPDIVTSISSGYDGDNHYFPIGYCTYYVASRMKITFGGNAKNWLANARASGYVTGSEPAAHAAVVFTNAPGEYYGRYGHVGYVESVNGDGTITISEMNYDHYNRVDTRTLSANDPAIHGYIYP